MKRKEIVESYYRKMPISYGGRISGNHFVIVDSFFLGREGEAIFDDGGLKLQGYAMIPREEFERLLVGYQPKKSLFRRCVEFFANRIRKVEKI